MQIARARRKYLFAAVVAAAFTPGGIAAGVEVGTPPGAFEYA